MKERDNINSTKQSRRRRALALLLAFVTLFSFPLYAAEGEAHAATGKVRLVMLTKRGTGTGTAKRAFAAVGINVTTVYTLKGADPEKYDGLIIPGGGNDIDPEIYGAKDSGKNYSPDKKYDKRQIKAVKKFAKAKKPIFGICRGLQVINVAFGGTLKQDIKRHGGYRYVKNKKGSWIRSVQGKTHIVFCSHHQAIKKLGEDLIATSYDKSTNNIEAIEHKTLPIYAVQWHPDIYTYNQGAQKVLEAFGKVCLKYRAK